MAIGWNRCLQPRMGLFFREDLREMAGQQQQSLLFLSALQQPLPNAQMRLCSRNRPITDLTVMVLDKPGTPGLRQQMPRTTSAICTPARLAQ